MVTGAALALGGLAFAPSADALRLYPSQTGGTIAVESPMCGESGVQGSAMVPAVALLAANHYVQNISC